MLAPPTGGSDRSRVDPTKLRNRKFQSGPRVGNAPAGRGGVDSSWTETPEEKIRRLQDEAMGISSSSGPDAGGVGARGDDKVAQAMREKVQRYNERVRGEDASSLVEEKKRERGRIVAAIPGLDRSITAASGWPPTPTSDRWKD